MVATIAPLVKVAPTKWLLTTAIFLASSLVGGAAAGWLCAIAGQVLFGTPATSTAAKFLAGAAVALAVLDTHSFGPRVPTLGGSVPRSWWERYGPGLGAVMYGSVLGTGMATVVPVASFYLLPAAAFLLGPEAGVAIGAAYGLARALTVPVASLGQRRGRQLVAVTDWMLSEVRPFTNVMSASALLALALAALTL